MNKTLKEVLSWIIPIAIVAVLYLTGLHTEVIGRIQQALLATGIIKPDTSVDQKIVASYDLQLVDLEGRKSTLSEMQGKVILLNLWATWCPPCIAEMPGLQSLYDNTRGEQVEFVMISLDEDIHKVKKFISRKGFTFPVYMLAGPLPALYQTNTIPSTYVISAEGMLVMQRQGMADYNSVSFRNFLLNQKENQRP